MLLCLKGKKERAAAKGKSRNLVCKICACFPYDSKVSRSSEERNSSQDFRRISRDRDSYLRGSPPLRLPLSSLLSTHQVVCAWDASPMFKTKEKMIEVKNESSNDCNCFDFGGRCLAASHGPAKHRARVDQAASNGTEGA